MNTEAENRAAMDRAKGPQPDALRKNGAFFAPKAQPNTDKIIPLHARTVRA